MKTALKIAILLFIGSTYAQNGWIRNFEDAQKLAIATNKLIVVDFWATWCGPCKKMEMETWNDSGIKEDLQSFVGLKVDLDNNPALAQAYGVRAIPLLLIVDPNGEIIYKKLGYAKKSEVSTLLKKYALSLEYLKLEQLNYFKNKNYSSGLRLAKKYIDYSIYLDPKIRKDFLGLASNYLKYSEDMLDKQQKNYSLIKNKIALMDLEIDLYNHKYNRVKKNLQKDYEFEELSQANKPLYAYLSYCLNVENGEAEIAENWRQVLEKMSNSQVYLKKANLLLN